MPGTNIVDVLIIGSGASAGPFAFHLSSLTGLKIMCLEQGDWVGKSTYKSEAQLERERLATPPQQGTRYFANGYPYDYTDAPIWRPILANQVGGASVHYGALWCRLLPSEFQMRTLSGMGDDWPIRYQDLAPYYDMNDRFVGVAGVPGNPARPPKSVPLMPPHKLPAHAEVIQRGLQKLGWHFWPYERAVLTRPLNGRRPCLTNCATCVDGCPREAKNSSDVVHWPSAIKNGVVLKTRAHVREITVDKRGLADGVVYCDADGKEQQQKARLVVLACNGFGTPRLLLHSTSNRFPHGLANGSGVVGRNLMSHPMAGATGAFDDAPPPDPPGMPTSGLSSDQFAEADTRRGFVGSIWLNSFGYMGPTATALGYPAGSPDPTVLRNAPPAGAALPWGRIHRAAFQERSRDIGCAFHCTELSDDFNRVELHPTLKDEFGVPGLKVFYRHGENTLKMMDFCVARVEEVLNAAGATKIVATSRSTPNHHLLGTARMGSDPKTSVVDKWGRAHEVKNLFIIDGSVFTTSGCCNPTSTIQAIALRTADYIKKNSRTLLTA